MQKRSAESHRPHHRHTPAPHFHPNNPSLNDSFYLPPDSTAPLPVNTPPPGSCNSIHAAVIAFRAKKIQQRRLLRCWYENKIVSLTRTACAKYFCLYCRSRTHRCSPSCTPNPRRLNTCACAASFNFSCRVMFQLRMQLVSLIAIENPQRNAHIHAKIKINRGFPSHVKLIVGSVVPLASASCVIRLRALSTACTVPSNPDGYQRNLPIPIQRVNLIVKIECSH